MTKQDLHKILIEEIEPAIDLFVKLTPGFKDDVAWLIIKKTILSEPVLDAVLGKLQKHLGGTNENTADAGPGAHSGVPATSHQV